MRSPTFTGREDNRDRCTKVSPLSFSRAFAPSEPSAKWSSADKMASSLSSVSALSANSILTPSSTADSLFSSSGSLSGSTTCTWHVILRKRRSDSPSPCLSLSLSLSLSLFVSLFHTHPSVHAHTHACETLRWPPVFGGQADAVLTPRLGCTSTAPAKGRASIRSGYKNALNGFLQAHGLSAQDDMRGLHASMDPREKLVCMSIHADSIRDRLERNLQT